MYDFSRAHWGDDISEVSERREYQTCTIRIEYHGSVLEAYDYLTNTTYSVDEVLHNIASGLDDEALLSALDQPSGTPVFRENVSVPVGLDGNVWVKVLDGVYLVFIYDEGWKPAPNSATVYSGQARYIPIRAGVWQGGEAQLNATTIRAVRFQVPQELQPERIFSGSIITIEASEYNPSLVGRTAKVTDDFQGSTTASRTINAMMDADSKDEDG